MPKQHIHAADEWIVVSDASPAFKTPTRWGPMVAAHRVHRDSTSTIPAAEGAAYVGAEMGINKAEYFAAIHGLRLVADRMYVGDWSRDPVHIVTDNAFVFNQGTGNWAAGELGWHLDRLNEVLDLLVDMTGEQVWFHHATNQQNAGAHTLAANYPKVCDARNREEWQRQHLLMRWEAVRQHVRDQGHAASAASLSRAWIRKYDEKTLILGFAPSYHVHRQRVHDRRDELRDAVTSVMGKPLREVRCVINR
jgi:ribonuclease HI